MKHLFMTLYTLTAVTLSVTAQPRFSSNTEMQNLGQIEWKHPETIQYTITNTGNAPLILTEVEPDCACTAAEWTQAPIAPGETGTVRITFDAEALGHFQKSVAIYNNAEPHLVYLYFSGEVVMEIKDFTRTHPYLMGQIRINCNSIDFPDVNRGEHPVVQVGVANLSDRAYEPVLMHMPSYIDMQASPAVLQKGEKGVITLTLNSEKLNDLGLTQASVYLSRFTGDKVSDENEIPLSAILLPDFSKLTETERQNAPSISLSETRLSVSQKMEKKHKIRQTVTVSNNGHSPLHINKLQVSHPAIGVSLKKNILQPGESTRLQITVQQKAFDKKQRRLALLMITNDPKQPKVEIEIN